MTRRMSSVVLMLLSAVVFPAVGWSEEPGSAPQSRKKVVKTDQEWAKILTRGQFLVCRMKVTEPAYSGKLLNNHAKGTYDCVACGAPLFSSRTKFNSGTGWPSFWQAIDPSSVSTDLDNTTGEARVEVLCSTCDSHLGHVFNDGPAPTGLRFCLNSTALKFVPDRNAASKKSKPKSKSKAKPEGESEPESEAPEPEPESEPTAENAQSTSPLPPAPASDSESKAK